MAHGAPDKDIKTPKNGTKAPAETPQGSNVVRAQTKDGAAAALAPREKAEVPKALGRLFCVRHGATANECAPAGEQLLEGEEAKAETIGAELWAAGVRPQRCVIRFDARKNGGERGPEVVRITKTAEAVLRGLEAAQKAAAGDQKNLTPFTCVRGEANLDTTDKDELNKQVRKAQTSYDSTKFASEFLPGAEENASPVEPSLANGVDEVWIIHKSNWEGICKTFQGETGDYTTNPRLNIKPLEIKEIDYGSGHDRARPGLRHDDEGLLYLRTKGLADFVTAAGKAIGAVPKGTKGRQEAVEALEKWTKGGVRIADLQNELNGIFIENPELAKSLAGCLVPELELMALRAAMGVRPYDEKTKFDGETAAKAFWSLVKHDRTNAAIDAVKDGPEAKFATFLGTIEDGLLADGCEKRGTELKKTTSQTSALGKRILETVLRAENLRKNGLEVSRLVRKTMGKSPDPRFHREENAGQEPIPASFRVGKNSEARGAESWLEELTREPGLVVVKAQGGGGKSLLMASMAHAWTANGYRLRPSDAPRKRLGYVDLHGLNIADCVEGVNARKLIRAAAKNSDVLLLDGLDEASWLQDDPKGGEKKKTEIELGEDFSEFLRNIAAGVDPDKGRGAWKGADEKNEINAPLPIILAGRPGHASEKEARVLALQPFGAEEADAYVRGYFAGHEREKAILPVWESTWDNGGPEFQAAAQHPLTLALMCEVITSETVTGKKPKTFAQFTNTTALYEEVATLRIEKWEHRKNHVTSKRGPANTRTLMDALGHIAYAMEQRTGLKAEDVPELLPKSCLDYLERVSDATNAPLLNPLQLIEVGRNGEITFVHETFREHYLIRHLRTLVERGENVDMAQVIIACGGRENRFDDFLHFPCKNMNGDVAWGWVSKSFKTWSEKCPFRAPTREEWEAITPQTSLAVCAWIASRVWDGGWGAVTVAESVIIRNFARLDETAPGVLAALVLLEYIPDNRTLGLLSDVAGASNGEFARDAFMTWQEACERKFRDEKPPEDGIPDRDETSEEFVLVCLENDKTLAPDVWDFAKKLAKANRLGGCPNDMARAAAIADGAVAESYLDDLVDRQEEPLWWQVAETLEAVVVKYPKLAAKALAAAERYVDIGRGGGCGQVLTKAVLAAPELAGEAFRIAVTKPLEGDACEWAWEEKSFLKALFQADPSLAAGAIGWLEKSVASGAMVMPEYFPTYGRNLLAAVKADPAIGSRALFLAAQRRNTFTLHDADSVMRRRRLGVEFPAEEIPEILIEITQAAARGGHDARKAVADLGPDSFGPLYARARLLAGESADTAVADAMGLNMEGWPLYMACYAKYAVKDPAEFLGKMPRYTPWFNRLSRARALASIASELVETYGPSRTLATLKEADVWDWNTHLGPFNQKEIVRIIGEIMEASPSLAEECLETANAIGAMPAALLVLLRQALGKGIPMHTAVSKIGTGFGWFYPLARRLAGEDFNSVLTDAQTLELAGLPLYTMWCEDYPKIDPLKTSEAGHRPVQLMTKKARASAMEDLLMGEIQLGRPQTALRGLAECGNWMSTSQIDKVLAAAVETSPETSAQAYETAMKIGFFDRLSDIPMRFSNAIVKSEIPYFQRGERFLPKIIVTREAAEMVLSSGHQAQRVELYVELLIQAIEAAPELAARALDAAKNSKRNVLADATSERLLSTILKAAPNLRDEIIYWGIDAKKENPNNLHEATNEMVLKLAEEYLRERGMGAENEAGEQ